MIIMKKFKFIGIFGVFALCFLCHFVYDWFPNNLFAIFFPVNESIWEHMKIIYTSYLLYSIIEYFLIKKYNPNNYLFQIFLVPLLGIILYLIIYIPLFRLLGENMIVSIGLLFIIIVLEEILSYYILTQKSLKNTKIIGFIGIILVYILFGVLTFFPPKNILFLDMTDNTYGIKKTT